MGFYKKTQTKDYDTETKQNLQNVFIFVNLLVQYYSLFINKPCIYNDIQCYIFFDNTFVDHMQAHFSNIFIMSMAAFCCAF